MMGGGGSTPAAPLATAVNPAVSVGGTYADVQAKAARDARMRRLMVNPLYTEGGAGEASDNAQGAANAGRDASATAGFDQNSGDRLSGLG